MPTDRRSRSFHVRSHCFTLKIFYTHNCYFQEYEREVFLEGGKLPGSVDLSLKRLREEPGSEAAISPSRDYVYIEG